jgi:hypothetical protein
MHLVWDKCVNTGKMSVQEYVRATSAAAAQIFGIYPQKGYIGVGSDADIAVSRLLCVCTHVCASLSRCAHVWASLSRCIHVWASLSPCVGQHTHCGYGVGQQCLAIGLVPFLTALYLKLYHVCCPDPGSKSERSQNNFG